jgi:hypothetical protein
MAWGLCLHFNPPTRKLRVQFIQFESASPQQLKAGYDTRIRIIVTPQGKIVQFPNHVSVGGNLYGHDARIIQVVNGAGRQINSQTPFTIFTAGAPSSVSFLISKAKLPAGQFLLRATVGLQDTYNIALKGIRSYDSPGVPVEVPIQ